MSAIRALRILPGLLAAGLLTFGAIHDASARNLSYSAGGGVKCRYVLTSSANGVNVYKTICSKSGV